MQGRVFSLRRIIAQISSPVATALAGLVGGLWNPGLLVAGLGAVLAVVFVSQMLNPVLLRVEDKEYLDHLEEKVRGRGEVVAGGCLGE